MSTRVASVQPAASMEGCFDYQLFTSALQNAPHEGHVLEVLENYEISSCGGLEFEGM
jgi:hypothetical protein